MRTPFSALSVTHIIALVTAAGLPACQQEPPPCARVGDICTVAGSGVAGFSGDGGPAVAADLYLPMDVVGASDGTAYLLDWNNHRVRQVGLDGRIRTVAGSDELGDETGDGILRETSFNHPTSAAFDPQGRLVIAAWHNSRIKRLDLRTGLLENIAGTGKRSYGGDGGPALSAIFDLPTAVAFGPNGALYVLDQANQTIRCVGTDDVVTTVAGRCVTGSCLGTESPVRCPGEAPKWWCGAPEEADEGCKGACLPGWGGDGGNALDMRMAQPFGQAADPGGRVAFSPDGLLHFADTRNHRIRRIERDGTVRTVAGSGERGQGLEPDGAPALSVALNRPVDLAFAPDGTLYIADTGNSCVRAVSPGNNDSAGGTTRTVAGRCGYSGETGDNGPATGARLTRPYGIDLDARGDLLVADTENNRLRRVRLMP